MKKSVKLVTLALLLLAMVVQFAGCASSTDSSSDVAASEEAVDEGTVTETSEASDDTWTVVVMPKVVGIPYFNAAETGALQAGEDLGVEVIYTGPTEADAAEQVKLLEDLIVSGVDAICVSSNDAAALSPVLQKAREKGILTIDWDSPAYPEDVTYSISQVDYDAYAKHIWDSLVEYMGDSGEYAILTGGLSAESINEWIDTGLAYAAETYPDLVLVSEKIPTDENQQEAYTKTLELIKTYPDLKGIIALSTPAPIGAAQAIQEKGLQDSIALVGSALPNDSEQYLMDGSFDQAILWDPAQLGYLCVYIAKQALDGEEVVDGESVPTVGNITVEEDGKNIIMGPPTDFTTENVSDYDF